MAEAVIKVLADTSEYKRDVAAAISETAGGSPATVPLSGSFAREGRTPGGPPAPLPPVMPLGVDPAGLSATTAARGFSQSVLNSLSGIPASTAFSATAALAPPPSPFAATAATTVAAPSGAPSWVAAGIGWGQTSMAAATAVAAPAPAAPFNPWVTASVLGPSGRPAGAVPLSIRPVGPPPPISPLGGRPTDAQWDFEGTEGEENTATRGGRSFMGGGLARHLGPFALLHAVSQTVQNEEAFRRNMINAGADPFAQIEAQVTHRTAYDSIGFGLGRLGRALHENVFHADEPSASDIEEDVGSGRRTSKILGDVRENVFSRQENTAYREARSRGGFAAEAAALVRRRDQAVRKERDREQEAGRAAYSFHTSEENVGDFWAPKRGLVSRFDLKEDERAAKLAEAADARRQQEEARSEHDAGIAEISFRRSAELTAIGGSIIVAGLRGQGRDFEARTQARVNRAQTEYGANRGDIGMQFAALNSMTADLTADRTVFLREQGLNSQQDFRQAALESLRQQTDHASAIFAFGGDTRAAGIQRIRGERDVRLQGLQNERTAALDALTDPAVRKQREGGINARFNAAEEAAKGAAADREAAFSQQFADRRAEQQAAGRDRETVTGLQAAGREKTAHITDVEQGAMRGVMNLRGPDAEENRRSVLQTALNEQQTYLRQLHQSQQGGSGQAAAPGPGGPGLSSGKEDEEDVAKAMREAKMSIDRLTDALKGTDIGGDSAGNDF